MQRIPQLLFDTARHEAKHAAYGAMLLFRITEVHVELVRGHVQFDTDFPTPERLSVCWQRDPALTTLVLRCALGAIMSPQDGHKFPTPCDDASMVGNLARVWQCLPPVRGITPAPWGDLTRQARMDVAAWYGQAGVDFSLSMLAHGLARRGTLDARAWSTLWQRDSYDPLRQIPATLVSRLESARRAPAPRPPTPKIHAISTPTTRRAEKAVVPSALPDWRTGGWFHPMPTGVGYLC